MSKRITQDMIDCWKINYGLDTMSPEDALRWWSARNNGMAPAGAVAALGLVLEELERLRAWLECDATCPCCGGVLECVDDCTFGEDCPNEHARMMEVRDVIWNWRTDRTVP